MIITPKHTAEMREDVGPGRGFSETQLPFNKEKAMGWGLGFYEPRPSPHRGDGRSDAILALIPAILAGIPWPGILRRWRIP
jgi:hypothetical protein